MNRREFIKLSTIVASILFSPKIEAITLENKNRPKIVILGGGFAGLSSAKYLKQLNPNLDVILIEKRSSFISCPMSNAWLGGIEDFKYENLTFDYNSSIIQYDYTLINETIVNINKEKKEVITSESTIPYDYLIMTLGIDYNYEKLFKNDKQKINEVKAKAPAGLKPGSELIKLKKMITQFKEGNFIITMPSSAYKCPPAPYERACMIANYFKTNGIKGKVILIDPRVKPASKPKQYLEAFTTTYKDFIEYKNLTHFEDVDFKTNIAHIVRFDKDKEIKEELVFEEISIIPPNKANKLYKKTKISMYTQGWVKLEQPTFRTQSDKDIYVIGDAQGEYPYPKSAQMANSCALILASDIIYRIKNKVFDYTNNLPGNICYSMIDNHRGVSVNHSFSFINNSIKAISVTSEISVHEFDAAKTWYKGFTNELFGL